VYVDAGRRRLWLKFIGTLKGEGLGRGGNLGGKKTEGSIQERVWSLELQNRTKCPKGRGNGPTTKRGKWVSI